MNEHLPVCVALQETLLKQSCTSNIRGYSILRKDCNTGERACGGVALLINHSTPFSPVLIRTSLQAVAVQQQDQTGYTILCYGICPKVLSSPFSHCLIASEKPTCFPHSGVMPTFYRFQSLAKIQHQQLITALLPSQVA
ncbi:hypothetical protein TNCV_3075791 [Trichonephila clavipes]|nr:hypothetical protein TNCV_3075791 [Trichonephila clavipes]